MKIISKVTNKNQVTIPAVIVRELGIRPGMTVEWVLNDDGLVTLRLVLSRYELAKQLQGKWKDLFPPDFDPIGDLIRERIEDDEERVRQLEGMLRPYLKPGDDPIGDLIKERIQIDEEID